MMQRSIPFQPIFQRRLNMDVIATDEKLIAIRAALYNGRKIEAIKIYRRCAGVGLYEAKQAVEALEAELRATSPEKFARPAGKGCFGVTASMLALGLVFLWWIK